MFINKSFLHKQSHKRTLSCCSGASVFNDFSRPLHNHCSLLFPSNESTFCSTSVILSILKFLGLPFTSLSSLPFLFYYYYFFYIQGILWDGGFQVNTGCVKKIIFCIFYLVSIRQSNLICCYFEILEHKLLSIRQSGMLLLCTKLFRLTGFILH